MTSFYNRFMRKKSKEQVEINSQEMNPTDSGISKLPEEPNSSESIQKVTAKGLRIDIPQFMVGIGQSIGVQRDSNEDAVFSLTTNIITNQANLQFGLYIIADGMGGYENGEIASRLAVENLTTHVMEDFYIPLLSSNVSKSGLSIQEIMEAGLQNAHQAIRSHTRGGGSTLTAALILGSQVTIAHVGDSRAYLVSPQGEVQLITKDHSLVKRLTEIGQISPDEALTHPQRNVLYRALGQGEPFDPDILSFQFHQGSQLVLCTDGLWGVLSEKEFSEKIQPIDPPTQICQSLVNLANSLGGPDNISVIIIRNPGGIE